MSFWPLCTLRPPWSHVKRVVAWSPNGCTIACGSEDRTISIWNCSTFEPIATMRVEGRASSVAYTPDSSKLASGGKYLQLWDLQGFSLIRKYNGHGGSVCAVAVSPNGNVIASGSTDSTIRLWRLDTAHCIQVLEGHTVCAEIYSVAFNVDGRYLASGSFDDTIRIWDLNTYSCIKTLTDHAGSVATLAYSADGRMLASGSWDKTICIYDVTTYAHLHTVIGHSDAIRSVTFSSDSTMLISGGNDRTIRRWDTTSMAQMQVWEGHSAMVSSVAVSPDNRYMVSGSWDGSVRVWERPPPNGNFHLNIIFISNPCLCSDLKITVNSSRLLHTFLSHVW